MYHEDSLPAVTRPHYSLHYPTRSGHHHHCTGCRSEPPHPNDLEYKNKTKNGYTFFEYKYHASKQQKPPPPIVIWWVMICEDLRVLNWYCWTSFFSFHNILWCKRNVLLNISHDSSFGGLLQISRCHKICISGKNKSWKKFSNDGVLLYIIPEDVIAVSANQRPVPTVQGSAQTTKWHTECSVSRKIHPQFQG